MKYVNTEDLMKHFMKYIMNCRESALTYTMVADELADAIDSSDCIDVDERDVAGVEVITDETD